MTIALFITGTIIAAVAAFLVVKLVLRIKGGAAVSSIKTFLGK